MPVGPIVVLELIRSSSAGVLLLIKQTAFALQSWHFYGKCFFKGERAFTEFVALFARCSPWLFLDRELGNINGVLGDPAGRRHDFRTS